MIQLPGSIWKAREATFSNPNCRQLRPPCARHQNGGTSETIGKWGVGAPSRVFSDLFTSRSARLPQTSAPLGFVAREQCRGLWTLLTIMRTLGYVRVIAAHRCVARTRTARENSVAWETLEGRLENPISEPMP